MFMQSKHMYIIFSFRMKLDELLMSENAFREQCNVVKKKKKKDPTGIIRRTATGVTNSLDFRVKLPCANPDSSASWFCDIRPITQSPHISPIGEKSQQCLVVP